MAKKEEKMKHDKAIKSIMNLIDIHKKEDELLKQLLLNIVLKKHFKEVDGHRFLVVSRIKYRRGCSMQDGFQGKGWKVRGLGLLKKEEKNNIILMNTKTMETHIVKPFPLPKLSSISTVRFGKNDNKNIKTK